MPFDPLSIIGYVGTTAGLLSFLASTIDSISTKVRHFRECRDQLKWYQAKAETTRLRLENWKRKWSSPDWCEEDFANFWGHDAFASIKRRIEIIQVENDQLNGSIDQWSQDPQARRLSNDLSIPAPENLSQQSEDWWRIIRSLPTSPIGRYQQPPHPKIAYRVCYALAHNTTLSHRVGRLSEVVDDLCTFTNEVAIEVHGISINNQQPSELQRLRNIQQGFERVSRLLTELNAASRDSQSIWALVLGDPKLEQGLERFEYSEDFEFTFQFLRERIVLSNAVATSMIKVDFPMQQTLEQWRNMVSDSTDFSCPIPLYNVNSLLSIKKHLWDAYNGNFIDKKALEVIRFRTALALANSVVLLHRTPWVKGLCTCGLRHTPLDNDEEICVFKDDDTHLKSLDPCFDAELADRPFLLLGVALSELAIVQPVRLFVDSRYHLHSDQLQFLFGGEQNDLSELLKLVRRQTNVKYKNAVRFCFQQDSRPPGQAFQPNDLQRCLQELVKPVEEYHNLLVEDLADQRHRAWYKCLMASYQQREASQAEGSGKGKQRIV